ncbi:MAG: NAD(+) diphosphatase [Burkholderiaceae bacterium]|nr:NAD(+) diphosphatase [Burkholderiaceae bacterium]
MPFTPAVAPLADTTPEAWCFAFVEGQLLLVERAEGAGLVPQPWSRFQPHDPVRHYIGRLDGVDCWAFTLKELPPGFKRTPLRAAMMQMSESLMGVAGRAAQILEWDRAHRFCGVCGTPTELQANERSRKCPACGHTAYPRLSPAMMVLVWRGPAPGRPKPAQPPRGAANAVSVGAHGYEVLLARSPHYVPGVYSALAGFVEPGESIEQCIHREVAEEVGVRVTDLRYYGSQSWPFPHSLMIAYTARWTDGDIVKQDAEIEDAQWYPLDALPKIPPRFSISGHLIRDTVVALGGPEPGPGAAPVR